MASISTTTTWLYRDKVCTESGKLGNYILQRRVECGFPVRTLHVGITSVDRSLRHCIKCKKENEDDDDALEGPKKSEEGYEYVSVERPPYYSYMDSTSGKLEPASGTRASIPCEDYWPEGTSSRVRAARASQPAGESTSFPSYGKNPGSRRKKNRKATEENVTVESYDKEYQILRITLKKRKTIPRKGFVVYNNEFEREEEEESCFELDKKLGRPHPFINPTKKKHIEKTLTSDEMWWNWRKPEKEQWSRWQRRRPDVETVFLKAMAETGQVKLYGEEPTLTETSLYRARRHLFKEERLQAERERLAKEGPMAFYSEWVKAWKRDTSREAVQKHFEEMGEDENTQHN